MAGLGRGRSVTHPLARGGGEPERDFGKFGRAGVLPVRFGKIKEQS